MIIAYNITTRLIVRYQFMMTLGVRVTLSFLIMVLQVNSYVPRKLLLRKQLCKRNEILGSYLSKYILTV